MANFSEIARKKVLGVPALYLAGAFVVILAVVAYRMKSTATDKTPPVDNGGTDESAPGVGELSDPYAGLGTQGTVTVQQVATNPADTGNDVKTNEDWVRAGAEWLTSAKGVAGSRGYSALHKYINGQDRTFEEQGWVDDVIKEKGQPPSDIAEGGRVDNKPAQRQFEKFPGKHTVTGSSDTTLSAISTLYYGSADGNHVDLLEFANPTLAMAGTLPGGTVVNVPAYHDPKYWVVTARMTWAQAAARNGISETQLRNLNNGSAAWRNAPYLNKGQRVRVA